MLLGIKPQPGGGFAAFHLFAALAPTLRCPQGTCSRALLSRGQEGVPEDGSCESSGSEKGMRSNSVKSRHTDRVGTEFLTKSQNVRLREHQPLKLEVTLYPFTCETDFSQEAL